MIDRQNGGVEEAWDAAARVAEVRERIARAAARSGRHPAAVRVVAAAKGMAASRVTEVVAAGVVDVGENYVQEAEAKRPHLPGHVRLHLIGHLQTNKAARAARLFDVVQTVDSHRIAEELARRRSADEDPLEVLVEVDFTGLPGRTGLPPAAAADVVALAARLPSLRVTGLMTVAAPVADADAARPTFAALRRLRDEIEERCGVALPELSMGMSDDFEVAVEEGATMVRLGRLLFGPRPPAR